MLEISDLHVDYAGNGAVKGVNLDVASGELVAVIGPNGAGKTTLLRAISGLVRASRGGIRFEGEDIRKVDPHEVVRRGVVHVPEGKMVLCGMSVRENLLLGSFARPRRTVDPAEFDYVLSLFPRLGERLDQLAGTLSGGEQQMLAIGRGLMGAPRLLMLDEPSLGIAPIIVERILEVIREICRKGIAVLLIEQNAVKALALADRAYVLDLGRIVASGAAAMLMEDDRVRQAYLGL